MRIGDICTRQVVVCDRTASALELAQLMRNSHVGSVVVADKPNGEQVPVGIVTDRDLVVQVTALEADPANVTAERIMGTPLLTAAEHDEIHETVELMRFKGVRRLPVVDEQGALVGIVSLDDLLVAIGDEISLLGKVLGRERVQEKQSRR